jgi:hypothetical protein
MSQILVTRNGSAARLHIDGQEVTGVQSVEVERVDKPHLLGTGGYRVTVVLDSAEVVLTTAPEEATA